MQFALDFGNTPFRPVPRSRASRSLRSPAGLPVKGVTPQNKVRAIPAHRARKEFAPRPEGTFFLSLREANAGERYLPRLSPDACEKALLELAKASRTTDIHIVTKDARVSQLISALGRFESAEVTMQIASDDEIALSEFEPGHSRYAQRLEAVRRLVDAGIRVTVEVDSRVKWRDAEAFARALVRAGASAYCVNGPEGALTSVFEVAWREVKFAGRRYLA